MTDTPSPVTIAARRDPTGVERVLRSLPDWFGIEEAIQQYVRDAADPAYESLTAWSGDRCVGVALISRHYPEAGELHLIAVDAVHRRAGVGRQLVERAASDLVATGAQLFSVHRRAVVRRHRLHPDARLLSFDGIHPARGTSGPRLDRPHTHTRETTPQ
jgi:GNAT superfamily N-acetyltransferase